ncbi:MAG: hypothetical protein H6711_05260 [Myxococcales bacterium]|nr:hypothetical protein [Myxococcales bacterium]
MTIQRRDRLPIARVEEVVLGDLPAPARDELERACYELWSEFFAGMDRQRFVATHLFDDTRLGAAYDRAGRLAGFYNFNVLELDVDGERIALLSTGVFIRLEYDAFTALLRRGYRTVLRLRLAHLRSHFIWGAIFTTPVAYHTLVDSFREYYPNPVRPTPRYIEAALPQICRRRQLVQDPADPFVVDFSISQRQIDALKASARLQNAGPHAREFTARVPNWEAGKALFVFVPVGPANFLSAAVAGLRRWLRRRARRSR